MVSKFFRKSALYLMLLAGSSITQNCTNPLDGIDLKEMEERAKYLSIPENVVVSIDTTKNGTIVKDTTSTTPLKDAAAIDFIIIDGAKFVLSPDGTKVLSFEMGNNGTSAGADTEVSGNDIVSLHLKVGKEITVIANQNGNQALYLNNTKLFANDRTATMVASDTVGQSYIEVIGDLVDPYTKKVRYVHAIAMPRNNDISIDFSRKGGMPNVPLKKEEIVTKTSNIPDQSILRYNR